MCVVYKCLDLCCAFYENITGKKKRELWNVVWSLGKRAGKEHHLQRKGNKTICYLLLFLFDSYQNETCGWALIAIDFPFWMKTKKN